MYTDTVLYENGNIETIGNYALIDDTIYTDIKANKWISYYPNGKLKTEGFYGLKSYSICSVWYITITYHPFKIGYWKYYYENGNLKAEGKYKITFSHEIFSRRRGDYISLVTKNWKFYNEQGQKTKWSISLKQEFEK